MTKTASTPAGGLPAVHPERQRFYRKLVHGVERARNLGSSLAVLFVDLDRFKRINGIFGLDAGNRIIREATNRIRRCLREGDVVSRLGGDEFAVLLEGIEMPSLTATVAQRIRAEFEQPFEIAQRQAYVSASVGIALYPRDGESAEDLMKRSDLAMYHAKSGGRDGFHFYSPESESRVSRRLDLESCLRRAVKRGELEVHYQPQARLSDGATTSVEALLRWNSPELGWIPPGQFIPVAEDTGLINSIGAWVIETAMAQARAWHDAGLRPLRMCVNVSARQLNPQLVETVARVLAQTGLPTSSLELEITEGVMVGKDPRTEGALRDLRAMGVGFAIDDFGTGYATFEYLKRLPVRTLKLDGQFVRGVCDNADDVAIVAATVSLARSFGLRLVAEGVETAEQLERLRKLGCDDCQGFHVHQPLPAATLEKLLTPKPQPGAADRPRLAVAR
jgi:diguanylate cyclase (GGDEF)-like protein